MGGEPAGAVSQCVRVAATAVVRLEDASGQLYSTMAFCRCWRGRQNNGRPATRGAAARGTRAWPWHTPGQTTGKTCRVARMDNLRDRRQSQPQRFRAQPALHELAQSDWTSLNTTPSGLGSRDRQAGRSGHQRSQQRGVPHELHARTRLPEQLEQGQAHRDESKEGRQEGDKGYVEFRPDAPHVSVMAHWIGLGGRDP